MVSKSKVYEEVLKQIRRFIEDKQLNPGDKLPSERELAEQLQAGRSSIREALRAMELLGLIETRRGEGTFLRAYRPYHMVELLSTFVLHESLVKEDLFLTKFILEKEATKIAMLNLTKEDFTHLKEIACSEQDMVEKHFSFFLTIFQKTENSLMLKIWQLVEEFTRTVHDVPYLEQTYTDLLTAIQDKNVVYIERIIRSLYQENLSET